ncbi:MAG: ATP-dependent protease, partial [Deltaproteobacteria bacterium]|nr:ATP-dependent protease [Deltaproteobacteria bacterium]
SIDQHGRVQAIGGVNEKIEGFYRVCKAVGLSGTQGVLIPRANVAHLMLERETVEAVSRGLFHVYAVEHVDQGIELLSGVPAGTPAQAGTMNYLVARRFREISDVLRDRPQGESRMVSASAAGPLPPGPPAPPRPPARGPGGAPPADVSG